MEITFDSLFKLTIFSHFFKVTELTPRMVGLLLKFCSNYVTYEFNRSLLEDEFKQINNVFAARTKNNSEFRLHIGQLPMFMKMLNTNYITPDQYVVEEVPLYYPVKIKAKLNPKITLRDYQKDIGDFIVTDMVGDNHSRLIGLQTGMGKTVSALAAVARLGTRTAIIILPTYMEKWAGDITFNLDTKPKRIMCIQGSDQLKGLIFAAMEGSLDIDFIIISLKTIQNFYKAYEVNQGDAESEGYGCDPEDLFSVLGVGNIIIDETHQHIHAVFKTMLYMHVPKVIALTATLISEDPTITRIHKIMYPKELRMNNLEVDKYVNISSYGYRFDDFQAARITTTIYRSNVYNHIEFEKSLIRKKVVLFSYLDLVNSLVVTTYIDDYQKGDKLIVFASSIVMCQVMTEYFKDKYPSLDVRRYVEDDPFANVIEADIRITTIQSGGTAIDIPNLRAAVMTTSIQSPVSNLQALGRLRKLKDRDVKFAYMYCEQVPKQIEYHLKKVELFKDRALTMKDFRCNTTV